MLCLSRLILCFIEVKVRKLKKVGKLKKSRKLRKRLLGNRGSLRSHWGNLRECMKLKEEVKGEQGLAALALGKFEEEYEI
jgi:hypothetical protein